MSVENLSTGIEASATGESLNSGDPAVHPAARHRQHLFSSGRIARSYLAQSFLYLLIFTGRYVPLAHISKYYTPVIKNDTYLLADR